MVEPKFDDVDEAETRDRYMKSISQFPTYMRALDARTNGQIPAGVQLHPLTPTLTLTLHPKPKPGPDPDY